MLILEGLATSAGIVIGPLMVLACLQKVPMRSVADTAAECARADSAIEAAKEQLRTLYEKTAATAGEEVAAIFEIHAMMLEDDDYLDAIHLMISGASLCAEYAVFKAGEQFSHIFSATGDDYMKERAADVRDLSERITDILMGNHGDPLAGLSDPVVVAAVDLLPSQTVQMDKRQVLALLSKKGSMNSHASILARSLGIPAVSALGDGYDHLHTGDTVIVDGVDGLVIVNPTNSVLASYVEKIKALETEGQRLRSLVGLPAVTCDGVGVELCANIGHPDEVCGALEQDAEGIGLFRSEFLYLEGNDFPSEQVQFEAYKQTLEAMAPRRVVIRTLDLGADKQAPYFNIPQEENPAMGYRAIRICLDRLEIFIPQLRALLRASVYGRLAVMFPMITSVAEVREIFLTIDTVKAQLDEEGKAYAPDVEFGVMIETPAAVMIADRLADKVDFFSIGTNDLTQYAFAADRMNTKISHIFDAGSVSVLRMIRYVANTAHQRGIWVGICGESACHPDLIPHYIAMGIDELSMPATAILKTKELVRDLSFAECVAACDELLG